MSRSPFIRAALSYIGEGWVHQHGFQSREEALAAPGQQSKLTSEELFVQALAMFEMDCVANAYLHVNGARNARGEQVHNFHIKFKKMESSGLTPSLIIQIENQQDLTAKASKYRKELSLKAVIKRPKKKPIDNWVKPGGAI